MPTPDRGIAPGTESTVSRRQVIGAATGAAAGLALPFHLRGPVAGQESELVPAGQAMVTSPRLPMTAIGTKELRQIINGEIRDWRDAGAPISQRIELIALEGTIPFSKHLRASAADYGELASMLLARPGAMAMAPVADIDFRVNVLAVDDFDPLRHASVDGRDSIRIAMAGDIVPGRNVHNKMLAYGDFTHPFRKVAAELNGYDIAVANLEGNLSSNIEPPADAHTFSFVSDPAMIEGMVQAGFDAMSLANNHARWNSVGWGDAALLDTMDELAQRGLDYFGAGRTLTEARKAWVKEVRGELVAMIGVDGVTANLERVEGENPIPAGAADEASFSGATADTAGTNPYALSDVLADIEFLVDRHDVVIPYFHMGEEYLAVPPDWAIAGARAAIDAGATMVVTNHPHVVQGMEIYKGKPIVYSLGNFIFDQMFAVDVRQGFILEIVVRGGQVVALRPKGVEIEDFNQPRLMDAGEHASLMNRFWWAADRIAAVQL
jgi:poly-gamma-glutamate synthesis protein (capsule biosynthesis protein)